MPTLERGQPGGQQRDREGQRRPAAGQRGELRVRLLDRVQAEQAAVMEERGGDDQHRHVHQAGDAHGDAHVDALEAQQPLALGVVARRDAALRQRRVQVDHVRHDRGAEDAGRQQHASRCPAKPGMKPLAAAPASKPIFSVS